MFLDRKPLFENNKEIISENSQFIINLIKEFNIKNIDFLACDTLNYDNWNNFYKQLSLETGVIVGASNDKTGNIKFGGDWILESTSQDIELVYFTKSIEYYTFLLDNPTWSSGYDGEFGQMVFSGNYMYFPNYLYGTIIQTNLDGTINNDSWASSAEGINGPQICIVNNDYLYVANFDNDTISKISLTDPIGDNVPNWATAAQGVNGPTGLTINGNYLYVSNINNDTISKISFIDPIVDNVPDWATADQGVNGPTGLTINGNYLYVSNINNDTISKISFIDPIVDNVPDWATADQGVNGPTGLTINGNYLYVTNIGNNTISKISLIDPQNDFIQIWASADQGLNFSVSLTTNGNYLYVSSNINNSISQISLTNPLTDYNTSWASTGQGLSGPTGLTINGNYLYVYNFDILNISQLSLSTPPFPCFKEDTQILTDQGYKPIQELRKSDLIKTLLHGFKPIEMIGKRELNHLATKERIKDQLYLCSKTEFPEVFEDLIITGCHSILVDNFINEEQKQKVIEINGRIFVTDKKYRLPACVDQRTSVYNIPGNYTIYHLALENDDYYMNYGIYANGLLVETCSKRYLKELSNMELIE
jgi:DNA-binding beta-propeller fold protein YncE